MHRLFISDLHLSDQTPSIETGLNDLMTRERGVESLVILGDFFEAWVGDDDDAPLAVRAKELLRRVSLAGCEILICRGNRDFMLGQQFATDIGGTLLADVTAMEVAGAPALVLHGDTLCTDDADYQQFRSFVHSPDWQAEMMEKSTMAKDRAMPTRCCWPPDNSRGKYSSRPSKPTNLITSSARARRT